MQLPQKEEDDKKDKEDTEVVWVLPSFLSFLNEQLSMITLMTKFRLKTLVWWIPVLSLLLALIFWQQTLSFLVEYSFKSYCKDCLQSELRAEKIDKNDWMISFEKPQLASIENEDIHLDAKQLILKFEPRLLEREIDLYITLIDPKIDFKKMAPALYSLLSRARTDWGLLKINHKVQIDNGVIDNGKQSIRFTVDHDFIKSNQMQLIANFGPSDTHNSITLNMRQPALKQIDLEVNCNNICCQTLSKTLEVILPSLKHWEIQSGILNGCFNVKFLKHQEPLIASKFDLKDFIVDLKPFGIEVFTPNLRVDYDQDRTSFIQLREAGHISFSNQGKKHLEFRDLLGKVIFSKTGVANLDAEGMCLHHNTQFSARFSGEKNGQELCLGVLLDSSVRKEIGLNLTSRGSEVEIEVKNFSPDEFDVIQTFFGEYSSNVHALKMRRGLLDAVLLTPLDTAKIQKLKLVSLNGENLCVDFIPWNISLDAHKVTGRFGVDLFAENFLKTFDAQVAIQNGVIYPLTEASERPFFSNINTDLTIEKGIIRDSLVDGKFMGLEGKMQINWNAPLDLMSFAFSGTPEHILTLIPDHLKDKFGEKFKHDNFSIEARVKRKQGKKSLEGSLLVSNDASNRNDKIDFGFDLESADDLLKVNIPKQELSILESCFYNGKFSAKQIDLNKYLSLFLFPDKQLVLSGIGDFEGRFNEKGIDVKYDAQDFILENEDLVIEIQEVNQATGYYAFDNRSISASLPVKNGTYFERNNGLLFTDIDALIELKEDKIHIPSIDTFCNGLFFSGAMLIDFSSPSKGVFSVEINAHTMKGKFSQVQQLFSHFKKPFFFVKMPFESDVSFRKEGGYCRFDFKPGGYDFQTILQGCLTEGRMKSENFDVAVEALSLDFDYDHKKNQLNFADIQGALLVGKPDRVEEYMIAGDHIRFNDYARNIGDFDVWIGDRNRDIIRLAGKTAFPENKTQGDYVEFFLNQDLTHFGDVHLNTCQFILKDWCEVEVCQLEFAFKMETLFRDLQRFSHTGFLFLSPKFLSRLNEIQSAGGDFSVAIDFDKESSRLNYTMTGKDLSIADYEFENFQVSGKRAHHTWTIDQLLLDQLSIAADIFYDEEDCKINFLGLQLGTALLAGMDGTIDKETSCLNGHVNLLEVDLERLNEWPVFQSFVEKLAPEGQLKGIGEIKVEIGKDSQDLRAEAALTASLRNVRLKGLEFQNAEGVSCHVTSDKGVVLRQVRTALKDPQDRSVVALLEVDKADYDSKSDAVYLEGMHFNVPVEKLTTLTRILGSTFPDIFSPAILDTCARVKRTGNFEGTLNVDVANPHHAVRLALKEGKYFFHEQEHDLNNFVLDLDPCEFKLLTQYRYQQHLFWALVNSKSPHLDYGRLILMDHHPDQKTDSQQTPLVVYWRNYPETGLSIETAEGYFAGLHLNLYRNPELPLQSNAMHLEGEVYANVREACKVLPEELGQKLATFKIGQGYALKGSYLLASNQGTNDIYFQGNLIGNECELKGYQFQQFQAEVNLTPQEISLKNVRLDDPCGVFFSDLIYFERKVNDQWLCSSPAIRVADFRPSMLRDAGVYSINPSKPLVVRQFVLHDLCGYLGQDASFTGYGSLDFANPHKKNLHNTIFAIPAEIISRIGLDLTVLTPVIGTISYEIRDGKIHFTRFKDVYSEGRHSKFYLSPNPAHESSMDFEGNLNVHVKMKQYNLLFKIAELFTVKVQGNLQKPSYSLNKHQKNPPLQVTNWQS